MTSKTLFRWASVAKPVTAVAALQLVERGKMALDAPARTYWKKLPKEGLGAVPVEALLRQQGGVGHYRQMGAWQLRLEQHYGNRARVIDLAFSGHGVALADVKLTAADVAAGHLVRLNDTHVEVPRAMYLVYPKTDYPDPRVLAFGDWFKSEIDAIPF